mgnify:FL=1
MKKSTLATAIGLTLGLTGVAHSAPMSSATFIMLDSGNNLVSNTCGGSGNCPNGVDPTLTGTIGNGVWSVASNETFFGSNWVAKGGSTFGLGTYTFDTLNGGSPGPVYSGMVVGAGQVGGHILFDWGTPNSSTACGVAECSIDVINVWNVSGGTYSSVDFAVNRGNAAQTKSTIIGPDGINGAPIQDSAAFLNFSPNFDFTAVPVPAAVWLFGSGLLGLVGVARRRKKSA